MIKTGTILDQEEGLGKWISTLGQELEIQAITDHKIEGVNFTITITHLQIGTQNNTNLHLI